MKLVATDWLYYSDYPECYKVPITHLARKKKKKAQTNILVCGIYYFTLILQKCGKFVKYTIATYHKLYK